jgi:hypothetical protein
MAPGENSACTLNSENAATTDSVPSGSELSDPSIDTSRPAAWFMRSATSSFS